MALTLHEAFVPNAIQILGGMRGIIDKAQSHCRDNGIADSELIEAKLHDDMWSLPWHVRACWTHSGFAINLYQEGYFSPDLTDIPGDWDAMRAMVDDAASQLEAVTPEFLEEISDKTIGFELGGKRLLEMTGQNFLLGFNQHHFFFHATTFYDILRHKGVALGKRDFTGIPRILGA